MLRIIIHTLKRAFTLASVAVIVVVLGSGCSDGSKSVTALTREQQADLRESVAPFEESIGFEVLLPKYLPSGTETRPVVYSMTGRDIVLDFNALTDPEMPIEKRARVEIMESLDFEAPSPELDPSVEATDVAGRPATIQREPESNSYVTVSIYWRESGVNVFVRLDWLAPGDGSNILLTPAMEAEVFRVAESLVQP